MKHDSPFFLFIKDNNPGVPQDHSMAVGAKKLRDTGAVAHMGRPEIMYEIFKNTKMTYSHLVKTINSLEAKKLLLTVKKGRRRIVHITRKGIRVQLLLDRIGDALK